VKEMSLRKTVHLGDDDEKHVIVFKKGAALVERSKNRVYPRS